MREDSSGATAWDLAEKTAKEHSDVGGFEDLGQESCLLWLNSWILSYRNSDLMENPKGCKYLVVL